MELKMQNIANSVLYSVLVMAILTHCSSSDSGVARPCRSNNHGGVLVLQEKGTEYSCRSKTPFSKVISSLKAVILGNTVTVAMNIIITWACHPPK